MPERRPEFDVHGRVVDIINSALVGIAAGLIVFAMGPSPRLDTWVWLCLIALAAGVAAALWWLGRHEPVKVDTRPRCRHCGYDLTGTVSGTCPECGTPVLATKCERVDASENRHT